MQIKIRFLYNQKGVKTWFESEPVNRHDVLKLAEDLIKTGRARDVEVIDELGQDWTLKEFKKLNEAWEEEPENITLLFDGSFDRHTGTAGAGAVVYYTKNKKRYRLRENAEMSSLASNNEAEYAALLFALQKLAELGVKSQPVTISGDSLTVLNQLSGDWPCYEESHARFLVKIESLLAALKVKPLYKPIDRRHNKEADQLAHQALNGTAVSAHAEIGT